MFICLLSEITKVEFFFWSFLRDCLSPMFSAHLVRSSKANMIWVLSINRPICWDPDLGLFCHITCPMEWYCFRHHVAPTPKVGDVPEVFTNFWLMNSVPMETCWLFSVCVSGCIGFSFYWACSSGGRRVTSASNSPWGLWLC